MLLAPLKPPTCEPDQLLVCTGRATGLAGSRVGAAFGRACTGISAANAGAASSESSAMPTGKEYRISSPPTESKRSFTSDSQLDTKGIGLAATDGAAVLQSHNKDFLLISPPSPRLSIGGCSFQFGRTSTRLPSHEIERSPALDRASLLMGHRAFYLISHDVLCGMSIAK